MQDPGALMQPGGIEEIDRRVGEIASLIPLKHHRRARVDEVQLDQFAELVELEPPAEQQLAEVSLLFSAEEGDPRVTLQPGREPPVPATIIAVVQAGYDPELHFAQTEDIPREGVGEGVSGADRGDAPHELMACHAY